MQSGWKNTRGSQNTQSLQPLRREISRNGTKKSNTFGADKSKEQNNMKMRRRLNPPGLQSEGVFVGRDDPWQHETAN
jgi:hypothetical protein